jgi:hypothetical protein
MMLINNNKTCCDCERVHRSAREKTHSQRAFRRSRVRLGDPRCPCYHHDHHLGAVGVLMTAAGGKNCQIENGSVTAGTKCVRPQASSYDAPDERIPRAHRAHPRPTTKFEGVCSQSLAQVTRGHVTQFMPVVTLQDTCFIFPPHTLLTYVC